MTALLIAGIIVMCLGVLGLTITAYESFVLGICFFFVLLIGVGIFVLGLCMPKIRAAKEKKIEIKRIRNGEYEFPCKALYEYCVKNNLTALSKPAVFEKVKIVVYNTITRDVPEDCYDMYYDDDLVKEYFERGKRIAKGVKEEELKAEITKELENEKIKYNESIKYLNYEGRNKKLRILQDEVNLLKKENSNMQSTRNIISSGALIPKEKEQDWATAGGIASGLAGGFAGAAVAADIQIKNAEIRARNEARTDEFINQYGPVYAELGAKIKENNKKIKMLEAKINKANLLVVSSSPKADVFKRLRISVAKMSLARTGTVKTTIQIELDPFEIFDVPAAIDGALKATLCKNGTAVASAYLVFPYEGVSGSRKQFPLDFVGAGKKNEKYTILFTPVSLWEIEKE